ncbi:PilC/PilY family type IV pilus protein, partial [Aquisalimonas sp.]|uniref:pilus assembly protein n=1 Tax=Aquisalimonas sp. TaxID=1872621 RepID=UPI0025C27EBE
FHVHSGINGYEEGLCGSDYNGCYRLDAATTQTYSLGGSAARHLERPLFYAAKWGGFNDLNNSGTPDSTVEWARDDDETMPRTYFYATEPQALEQSLAEAFTGVLAATASATSVAQNSTELQEDSLLFQARFDSDDWSGTLLAFNLDADDPTSGSPTQNLEWDAAEVMENRGHGTLVTWDDNNNTGIHFSWSALNAGQQNELSAEYDGEALLGFLSGKRDGEDTTFRARGTGPLGDIVHSDPAFAGTEDFGYAALDETGYNAFLDRKKDRPEIVYVGANDGMLHAFNAEDGEHVFGYVPNLLFPELSRLAAPDYNDHHRYFVDGSPRVADAYINDSWATVLVGTLGRGGSGVFALDVTSPGSFGPSDVLWEFDNNDLGHAIGQPAIVKLETGEWTALVHNGYDSHSNAAQLFIIDLESGDLIDRIDTGAGTGGDPNGLSQVTPVDTTGSGRADAAYAGDLHGNVWVFHLADRTVERLFTATDDGGEAQPITAAPAIATAARGDNMVFVGTGRYLSNSDIDTNYNGRPQSLYGLLDTGEGPISGRDELTEQELLAKLSVDEAVVRVTSDNDAGPRGWYLDLVYDGNYQGERIVNRPILRGRRLVVTTLIPSEHPCQFGGSGFLMELDAQSGSRPFVPVLDITGDGEFDTVTYTDDDGEEIELPPSGKRLEGIPTQPAVKEDPDDPTQEHKYIGTSSGAIEVIKEGGAVTGTRQLWRQLR